MHMSKVVAWCVLLSVASTNVAAQTNSTKAVFFVVSTIRHEPLVNATRNYDQADAVRYQSSQNTTSRNDNHFERFRNDTTNNDRVKDDEETRDDFRAYFTKDHEDVTVRTHPYELPANLTESDSQSIEVPTTVENGDVILYERCSNSSCVIQLCCALDERLVYGVCVPDDNSHLFPNVRNNSISPFNNGRSLNDLFKLIVRDPCQANGRYVRDPAKYLGDDYMFLTDGSLYAPTLKFLMRSTSYCLAVVYDYQYVMIFCSPYEYKESLSNFHVILRTVAHISLYVSEVCLLLTFVVYSLLPELWNMHGYTLRAYVGTLFVAFAATLVGTWMIVTDPYCSGLAFLCYFSYMASFFWLNVISIDIWRTFGRFRSLQESVKQRGRKKFIIYSIYAWGSASFLTSICAIIEFIPSVPEGMTRPEFTACRFGMTKARILYYAVPICVLIICNICLLISTLLKIVDHKRDTALRLGRSESTFHDGNKQWLHLCLKLSIVVGITWSLGIMSPQFSSAPYYVTDIGVCINCIHGLSIFIIFVWKKKIWRMFLKRISC